MIGLWDTKGSEIVKALAAERRGSGGVASGLVLTLVAVVDEGRVRAAEEAATIAAAMHPCRLLIVVRHAKEVGTDRLDAEIVVGGRLGPCEAVVMRMSGRLAKHAESVVMPLLAPDVPVVTWWHAEPPTEIARDPLGVYADRRITDAAQASDPVAVLGQRARDYVPGDTDLAWTRITPWRTLIASMLDNVTSRVAAATVTAPPTDPTAALMRGWLAARLGIEVEPIEFTGQPARMKQVSLSLDSGEVYTVTRDLDTGHLTRTGRSDQDLPLIRRPLGDELAEELRRLDADQLYASALSAATGISVNSQAKQRVHVWEEAPPTVGAAQ
jgi:glucose-6-phosphate dehydrogenase assembly protein OpcA